MFINFGNSGDKKAKLNVVTLAVLATLSALSVHAQAQNDELADLVKPTNSVEAGVIYTSDDSPKFGEYNGLEKSGTKFLGNFRLAGGDPYNGGALRWSVTGDDLGLTTREIAAQVSEQGTWNIGLKYDELRHNMSQGYQTPYLGESGGNVFKLPTGFGTVANTRALTPAQMAMFHGMDIHSSRKNTALTAGFQIDSRWDVKFDYKHSDQSGSKLIGFSSTKLGTEPGQNVSILPTPTEYKTDTVNLALNWVGDQAHFSTSYYGSFLRNAYEAVYFQTWGGTGGNTDQLMSVAPNNNFHQFNFAGGYAFTPKTKLTSNFSYARNTQNDNYVFETYKMVSGPPKSSLDGLVVTTHADVKLIDQSIKDLTLSGTLKYDERNNKTESNIYNFYAVSGAHIAAYPNTPLNLKKTQLELAGDYRLDKMQRVRLAYTYEKYDRWCGQYAVNANYPVGTNCVVAKNHKDNKLEALYKIKPMDGLDLKFAYAYADRNTESDPKAITSMYGTNGNYNNGGGTITGLNAGDWFGFHPMFSASRTEHIFKTGTNWQADDKLSLGLNARYTKTSYDSDDLYGAKKGQNWSLSLDSAYQYSDEGSIGAYLTQQYRQRDLHNIVSGPGAAATATSISRPDNATYDNLLKDSDTTFGINFQHNKLMGSKLDLSADLSYSLGKTYYETILNYEGRTTGGLTCADPLILTCGKTPDIKNTLTQFKLGAIYHLDKQSQIGVRYIYQRLKNTDYFYNGYAYNLGAGALLPSNEQDGTYKVNVFGISYIYNFK